VLKYFQEVAAVKKNKRWGYFLVGGAIGLLLAACASPNVLNVNYQLPPPPAERLNRTAVVAFEDARRESAFLTPSARGELEGFSNVFALTVSGPGGRSELRGAYETGSLFKEMLRERLEISGVKTSGGAAGAVEVRLVLKEFRLDYADRKFIASTAYDVALMRGGETLGRQSVDGSAERLRIVAKTDAEKTIGDLVSETLNKLDVKGLFARAGL
jgi:hypothetical protein